MNQWQVIRPLPSAQGAQRFEVRSDVHQSLHLTLYDIDAEPDLKIFETLQRQPQEHVEKIYDVGRWESRTYCVAELINGGTLAEYLRPREPDLESATVLLRELGTALASFSTIGLRHRALQPSNILVRTSSPLDLVITGFESARLSDFDLDVVSPLQISRYSAPEAIVGAVSASSDWWSLGVILLEHLSRGSCFADINDQAFMLSTVTRGIAVPTGLNPRLDAVLRGLLARDPSVRWQWSQLSRWLEGDTVEAPASEPAQVDQHSSQPLTLAGSSYFRGDHFALAAAERTNWDEGRALALRGALVTWAEQSRLDRAIVAALRRVTALQGLADDHRYALLLQTLNRNLPFTLRGDIVTPDWLLKNPSEAYEIISGGVIPYLRQAERERWLVQIADRVQRLRERAQGLEIVLDEERFRVTCLASSRPRLEALWEAQRQLLPDSNHAGLASLLDRTTLSEEDLILLLSATPNQFEPADSILQRAAELAGRNQVTSYTPTDAAEWLRRSRRAMYEEVEKRLTGFARCGLEVIDNWADTLRVQRRIALPRLLVMLSIPTSQWQPPPRQQYVENLLEFFEKRAASVAQRGPLVRMIIGKTTPRVDLFELTSASAPAGAMLDRFVSRAGEQIRLDPAVLIGLPAVTERLRRLQNHASLYRRDTGVDGLYLGFPFVVMRSASTPRPRIVPLLLWPARVTSEVGSRNSASFAFDLDRGDVRLNPAIHALFTPDDAARLRELLDEVLQTNALNAQRVMDTLGTHIQARETTLARLPGKEYTLPNGHRQLVCSAVLFHAEFMGQAIAEDLRTLRRRSVTETALDAALRSQTNTGPTVEGAAAPTPSAALHDIPETERFAVVPSDPSQEAAVFKARHAPGLLIEGPPGTGKSQTIVNIISDCIGRGESVLVVCQKQVAIQVVAKRLDAEGLLGRAFVVGDLGSDRQRVLTNLREQLARITASADGKVQELRAERRNLAQRVQSLQNEIDTHHVALHTVENATGLSYRAVLSELIEIEQGGESIEAPALRAVLGSLSPPDVSQMLDAVQPLALAWLESRYENSPLAATRPFSSDAATAREFRHAFVDFITKEAARKKAIAACPDAFEVEEAKPHETWLAAHNATFSSLPDAVRHRLSVWYDHFVADDDQPNGSGESNIPTTAGAEAIASLERVRVDLKRLDSLSLQEQSTHRDLASELSSWSSANCKLWKSRSELVLSSESLWARLNPKRIVARTKLRGFLKHRAIERSAENVARLDRALALELALRPIRVALDQRLNQFEGHDLTPDRIFARGIDGCANQLLALLRPLVALATAASSCPLLKEADAAIRSGHALEYERFAARYRGAIERLRVHHASQASLEDLREWFPEEWLQKRLDDLRANTLAADELKGIADAIPAVSAYQSVRGRIPALPAAAIKCLTLLRKYQPALMAIDREHVASIIARTLARESRLAWKERMERSQPSLLLEHNSLATRVKRLEELDDEFVRINRELIAADSGLRQRPVMSAWESITRLTGPRARRLRELFDAGLELGLLALRPVWLMNPDVASRVLPLSKGLFDVVVFDEASQIPVEHALPSLYRAKRVVVSGDEKQMPPSSFFSSQLTNDEDELFDSDEADDAVTESARAALEDQWNRREIKDCEDLLTLARTCLPAAMLEIHYRSNSRELINFSNAAYYGGDLYVPVQNPDERTKANPPIVVQRINGTYKDQLNGAEAAAVVEVIHGLWKTDVDPTSTTRPSLGVVTFNRKQADLILDLLEQRAEEDQAFRQILSAEGQRRQDGEDMSFFVKNVENVQGDERDIIVFSTTFGRDESTAFHRRFGVLGQARGERRLNVAITRARDKIILVTSMPVGEISDMLATGRPPSIARDYLQAYMEYASKVSDGDLSGARGMAERCQTRQRKVADASQRSADGLVRSVEKVLRTLGVNARPTNDSLFGLDFAIESAGSGRYVLGIECDGPRHGLLRNARARDVWRPKVLRRSMPIVHRVSSYAWYHDRLNEQKRLEAAVRAAVASA